MANNTEHYTLHTEPSSNIIFGPIHSRRFGKSLGVDLSPSRKQCNFDCLYCELEPAKTMDRYQEVVSVEEVVSALKVALEVHKDIDFITLTANGEPTLYPYLDTLMDEINRFKADRKTLILSNAANISSLHIQNTLLKFDEVKLSLDCATQRCLRRLDRAHEGIEVEEIKAGMLAFKARYHKPLIIEILFVENLNDTLEEVEALNAYLSLLRPTRIDIGTIDRPPAYDVNPLSYEKLFALSRHFESTLPVYIASRKKREIEPSSYSMQEIIDTLSKRPLTLEDIEVLLDAKSQERFYTLLDNHKIEPVVANGVEFYKKR